MAKIKKAELEKLQTFVNTINQLQTAIGGLELQKQELVTEAASVNSKLRNLQAELKEEYGDVTVDLKTGEITDADNSQN